MNKYDDGSLGYTFRKMDELERKVTARRKESDRIIRASRKQALDDSRYPGESWTLGLLIAATVIVSILAYTS